MTTKDPKNPEIYFLAGINGAGKSTLREYHLDFFKDSVIIDPDALSRKYLDKEDTTSANIKGGKDAVRIFEDSIKNKKNICIEGTLSGHTTFKRYKKASDNGYKITTLYVGLESVDLHKSRVRERVAKGGHHIDEKTIEKRYSKAPENLKKAINLSDETFVYDNTKSQISLAFQVDKDKNIIVNNSHEWTNSIINELNIDNTLEKNVKLEPESKLDIEREYMSNTIEKDDKVINNTIEKDNRIIKHYETTLDGKNVDSLSAGSFIYKVDTKTLESQQVKFVESYKHSKSDIPFIKTKSFNKEKQEYTNDEPVNPKEVISENSSKEEIKKLIEENKSLEKELGVDEKELSFSELISDKLKNAYIIKETINKDLSFYDKNDTKLPAFEANEKKLSTIKEDEKTISAMLELAKSQNWDSIKLTGTEEFRREAWLQASLKDIEVKGYTPRESDIAELEARNERIDKNTITGHNIEKEKIENLKENSNFGKVVDFGQAPFPDKPKSQSFFVEVEREDGSREKSWGMALMKQFENQDIKIGDKIAAQKVEGEKTEISLPAQVKNSKGEVTEIKDRSFKVQSWNIQVIERAKELEQPTKNNETTLRASDHRSNLEDSLKKVNVSKDLSEKILKNFDNNKQSQYNTSKLNEAKPKAVEVKQQSQSKNKDRER